MAKQPEMNFFPWKKPPSIRDPLPPIDFINGEPLFRVFVLGTSKAGKTVFLASLYNQLSRFNRRNHYRVELESEDHRSHLVDRYSEIARPDHDWPEGTVDATHYEFRCFYPTPGVDLPMFRFRYADFPGGRVTAIRSTQDDFSVREATKAAHTIVVLIDGYKVYKKIHGIDDGGPTLDDDFNKTLDIIQPWIRRPLQFVITKHDLLQGHDLAKIRAVLMSNQGFRDVVEHRRELAVATHLIPVSAVGPDFAVWDRKTGEMRKKPHAAPAPYNVELTLSLTISDALLTRFKQEEGRADIVRKTAINAVLYGTRGIDWLVRILPWISEDLWVLRMVALWSTVNNKVTDTAQSMQQAIAERLDKIKDQNSAIENIIQIQRLLHEEFYRKNRASNLLEDV
jgi:hypothetical protein